MIKASFTSRVYILNPAAVGPEALALQSLSLAVAGK